MKRFFFVLIILAVSIKAAVSPVGVALAWTPSIGPNVTTQKIYYSTAPVDPTTGKFKTSQQVYIIGNVIATYTVSLFASGTYYFAATAVDSAGDESPYSNVVSKTVAVTRTLPTPPTNLTTP